MIEQNYRPIVELVPQVQSYDWGKLGKDGSKVAEYSKHSSSFKYDPDKPYAELWMGTHPSLPSRLIDQNRLLFDHISHNPQKILGQNVLERYGSDLPFLLKVLAIGKALSIQAHPDKTLAEKLHKEKPEIYKDPNHKPEMAIAITPFSGFCGFRPMNEISKFLGTVPEFSDLVGDQLSKQFTQSIPHQSNEPSIISSAAEKNLIGIAKNKGLLRDVFSALMNAPKDKVSEQVQKLVKRIKSDGGSDRAFGTIEELILRLNEQFPDDVGIFCAFVLNVVHLSPGEAAFLKADEPHAYLTGDIIECMASSDNVVRAGLTPKLRDVPTLVEMLTYSYGPAASQLMKPVQFKDCKHTTLYDPPIEEFSVILTDLPNEGDSEEHPLINGPSILITTEGIGDVTVRDHVLPIQHPGQIFFVSAGENVKITNGSKNKLVGYRAFIEV
ncbi:phosphomannose isomerase type I [Phakopsora pachyrhizi]|uniref:Mannose-6-phosphate isomerase n=1 Tax=Phakopsora pachyrhizi TaxID=170000 RepID=A0AAV0AJ20_PHAPC|nr:phosphomannose isomerase type I [Phakopsora pachyrhizi]CAH7667129.1 phosphomannose isomerase type I [Phakopsora pachyrhizi]